MPEPYLRLASEDHTTTPLAYEYDSWSEINRPIYYAELCGLRTIEHAEHERNPIISVVA
jgi:hypothetical protein